MCASWIDRDVSRALSGRGKMVGENDALYRVRSLRITTIYTMEVLKVESDEATIRQLVLCYGKVTVGPFDKSLGTQLVAS
jgi:hypothetical protein